MPLREAVIKRKQAVECVHARLIASLITLPVLYHPLHQDDNGGVTTIAACDPFPITISQWGTVAKTCGGLLNPNSAFLLVRPGLAARVWRGKGHFVPCIRGCIPPLP